MTPPVAADRLSRALGFTVQAQRLRCWIRDGRLPAQVWGRSGPHPHYWIAETTIEDLIAWSRTMPAEDRAANLGRFIFEKVADRDPDPNGLWSSRLGRMYRIRNFDDDRAFPWQECESGPNTQVEPSRQPLAALAARAS